MIAIRSFRLRIALLMVFLSGLVLMAFGAWSWSLIRELSLDRIDDEIRGIGHRNLSTHQPPEYWDIVGESLSFIFGDEEGGASFFLLVKDRRDETLHVSEHWPAELPVAEFPPPTGSLPPLDEPPMGEGYPRGPFPGPPRFRQDVDPRADVPNPNELPVVLPDGTRVLQPPIEGFRGGRPPDDRNLRRGLGQRGGPPPRRLPVNPAVMQTREAGGELWRIGIMGNPEVTMVLGLNLDRFNAEMDRARNAFLVALPSALGLIAAGGWLLARRALRPVATLTRTAERITARGLDQRIPPSEDDAEFVRLIGVFNQMLDRLEKSFHQAVRFSADAAHELKTPLTILQGELEQALLAASAGSPQQQTLNRLLEEVQRLKSIMRKLLLLSLADSGQLKLTLEPMDLSAALESVCEDTQILAPHLTVEPDITPGIRVNADRDLLRQVVQNLTGNAIKYNRKDGTIRFWLREDGPAVLLTIANTGKSIPSSERERIFDRFYRADPSRNRKIEGVGLGLSLAREIARAHHGDLRLDDSQDGIISFTLALPPANAR
jgi:heavy metal sensor kinase